MDPFTHFTVNQRTEEMAFIPTLISLKFHEGNPIMFLPHIMDLKSLGPTSCDSRMITNHDFFLKTSPHFPQ